MSSIDFFVPVIYSNQIKTLPQQALEAVDEYFYLGNKYPVTIFPPDASHPHALARQNRGDRYSSWKNVALKVASYCTLIFPLIALSAKVILRWYLQVSSIKIEEAPSSGGGGKFKSFDTSKASESKKTDPLKTASSTGLKQGSANSSLIKEKLPNDILTEIGELLSYKDQGSLAQCAVFTRDIVRNINERYINSMKSFETEIEALPPGQIGTEDLQRLLVGVVTSIAVGHPKYWVPVMDSLMRHVASDNTIDGIIQTHANLANLLATSGTPISSEQIYQFCKYLGQKHLSQVWPWSSYRALEQYALKLGHCSEGVQRAIKEYLTEQAQVHIKARSEALLLSNNRVLEYKIINIDSRLWFGLNGNGNSLWVQPGAQNEETAVMPEMFLDVLWTRIKSLQNAFQGQVLEVSMQGSAEARLPRNFTLELGCRIVSSSIFLDYNGTIQSDQIQRSMFGQSLGSFDLNNEDTKEHFYNQNYPNAIVTRKIVASQQRTVT